MTKGCWLNLILLGAWPLIAKATFLLLITGMSVFGELMALTRMITTIAGQSTHGDSGDGGLAVNDFFFLTLGIGHRQFR